MKTTDDITTSVTSTEEHTRSPGAITISHPKDGTPNLTSVVSPSGRVFPSYRTRVWGTVTRPSVDALMSTVPEEAKLTQEGTLALQSHP